MTKERKELKINDIISHQMFVEGTRFVVTDNNPSNCGVDASEDENYRVVIAERDPVSGKYKPVQGSSRRPTEYIFSHDFDDEYVSVEG